MNKARSLWLASLLCVAAVSVAQEPGAFSRRNARAAYVARTAREAAAAKAEAAAWARARGLPLRYDDGRQLIELMFLRDGRPVYNVTHNRNAAISTAADLVRSTAPYSVDGAGFTVGEWDGGSARATHQEFGGRVNVMDGAASHYHATHVGGTLGAAGVVADALGMAPGVTIDSYDWSYDTTEMAARGAATPAEPGSIPVSNHSYGHISGWVYTTWGSSPSYAWHWSRFATWSPGAEEPFFGQYDSSARDYDQVVYNAPYYLPFKSAGNDRNDGPSNGETVYYTTDGGSTWNSKAYDDSVDPLGDGVYKGGYDTIPHGGVSKNQMTVGAVYDAVSGGARSLANAGMSSFSGWGPADDGRIKPDIVANGTSLYSCDSGSDSDYASMSGTSMSAPNASGSAMLLVAYYDSLFPGQAMLASTLKGLILHTADDLGNAGPDYTFGWGLMNTEAAAEHIRLPDRMMIEGLLTSADPSDVYTYTWNGVDPIRVTLCWTDPPGTATSVHDDTTPKLVNDLDLAVTGPDGSTVYLPYALDPVNPSAPATTGENDRDNVEQVYVASPAPGVYTLAIDFDGTLTDGQQRYSLLISGLLQGVAPVSAFSAAAFGTSRIDLAWSGNVSNDDVVVAFSTNNVFGAPADGTAYPTGAPLGAATVIYNGSATNYQHTGLQHSTRYYYRAWSVNAATEYSAWRDADAQTLSPPAEMPFFDDFEAGLSPSRWSLVDGATADGVGMNEPSGSLSARLNGMPDGSDELRSVSLDLSPFEQVAVSYFYQRTGGGNSTESGEDLVLEYMAADGTWIELDRQLGSGADMTVYEQREIQLPPGAMHAGFRFRFTNTGTASTDSPFDDWFVDDVSAHAVVLTIVTTNLPVAVLNSSYSASLHATNGTPPYVWSVAGGNLQSGLSFSPAGLISGTPTETGTNQVTFRVEDSAASATNAVLDVVVQTPQVDHFVWAAIPTQQVTGAPFAVTLTAKAADGQTVTTFPGPVSISGWRGAGDQARLLITECNLGTDFIEIQNVSGAAVDASGWRVAVSDSYTDINVANATEWTLPSAVSNGAVLYRTDSSSDNYWGRNIFWNGGENGWAMIVDGSGSLVDFVAWGWSAPAISNMAPSINGSPVSVGDQFSGPGVWAGGTGTIQRVGSADNQMASDFSWVSSASKGEQNSGLGVPFAGAESVAVSPTNSGPFVSGVWTGSVAVLEAGTNVYLRAVDDNGHAGDSNPFDVGAAEQVALDVASAFGMADPPAGRHTYAKGAHVVCAVTNADAAAADQQSWAAARCIGWTGTGSVPAAGTGTNVSFVLTLNSSIAWKWEVTDLVLSNQLVAGTVATQAVNTVSAGNSFVIAPTGSVTFHAGQGIRLTHGFLSRSGSVFRARIRRDP